MVRVLSKIALAGACMLALTVFTQQAKASGADFICALASCGNVTASGGNYSATSITLLAKTFNIPGFDTDEQGENFTLAFNTATGAISLTDSTDADATITGTIVAFNCQNTATLDPCASGDTQDSIHLGVRWNIPGFAAGGGNVDFLLDAKNSVTSADLSILPTPEPASLMLLGTGLLGMGAAVRRRLFN